LERLKKEFTKIWKAQPKGVIFLTKLRKIIKFLKEFCKGCKILQKGVQVKTKLGMC
jgi:hypothetical protein